MLATLLRGGPVLLDGGLSTALGEAGHDLSDELWSARLLRDDPAAIARAHRAFAEAGAQVAITASYQASVEGFARAGIDRAGALALIGESVRLARGYGVVAGSVGPYGAMLADGSEYTGAYGPITRDDLRAFHKPRIAALLAAGADCLAFETIPRIDEAAVLAELAGPCEAWLAFSCRDGAHLASGEPIEDAVRVAELNPKIVAVGINCTAPQHIDELLERARTVTALPLVCYPNSGWTWDASTKHWLDADAHTFSPSAVAGWVERGARLVGGCCGIGPHGIAQIAAAL